MLAVALTFCLGPLVGTAQNAGAKMRHRFILAVWIALALGFGNLPAATATDEPRNADVRLYALDCGAAEFKDISIMSDTGHYDGRSAKFADPCFLVRHRKGWLLWDTGLGDALVGHPQESDSGRLYQTISLKSQLEELGLSPRDITYVSFSHLHSDHTGNANEFLSSTWLIQRAELKYAKSTPTPFAVTPATFSGIEKAKTVLLDGDYDVFGDGTVRLLFAPGHTPGHQVLEVKLSEAGVIVVSGDLYHLRECRHFRQIPAFNTSRADTLASIDRIETILKNTHGRLIIQHDPKDFESLPKLPGYLK
jgi:glyoxylase-like metal-dependent hydrolase (beta-lactamase superfamily II)